MNDSRMKTLLKWRPTNAGDNVLTFALGNRCIQTFHWTRLVHTQAAVGNHHFVHCDVTGRSRQVSTSMFLCVSYWFSSKLHGQAPPKAVPCGTENQRHDFNVRRSIFNGRVLVSHLVAIVDCCRVDKMTTGMMASSSAVLVVRRQVWGPCLMMLCDLYHTHTTLSKGPSPWECSWAPGGPGRTPAVGVRSLAGPVSLSWLTLVGSVAARCAHGIW